ncbi:MAG TPA: hypothetical protein VK772_04355 [Puia sp.]|nr:hypothetical protein [Puia sp.]
MDFNYRETLPEEFDTASRIWIYQANRSFDLSEVFPVKDEINKFIESWYSHGIKVKGYGNLFFGQFILLMADERGSGVSGCSTDSSVHFIKEIENRFSVGLLERQTLAFLIGDNIHLLPISQLSGFISNGTITNETLFFNNTVSTKKELENNWIIPIKHSWLASRQVFQEGVSK